MLRDIANFQQIALEDVDPMFKLRIAAPAFLLAVALATAGVVACNKSSDGASGEAAPGTKTGELAPQSADELGQVLAKVDDTVITVGEFQDRINRQSPYIRARYTSLEQKKDFLDNLIRFEVLAGEASRRGLDKDPDVVRTMKQVMIQKLMKDEFETRIKPEDITDEQMKAFYEEHRDEYNKPEEVRVSAIVVNNKKVAERAAKEASGETGATNKGFRDLVTKYSEDEATKLRGGDLRYFSRESQEVPAPVIEAAFALVKTGDVAGPVEGGDGKFYVIKQTGRRKALTKEFEEVKRQIQNRLYRDQRTQAQKDFIDGLKAKAKITIDDKALGQVRVDTTISPGAEADPHVQAVPAGEDTDEP
jgi:peptidyl-prolyl cis-trans isomerase C